MTQYKMDKQKALKLKNEVNGYIVTQGLNFTSFAKLFSKTYGRNLSGTNMIDKFNRGSIKYLDMMDIADLLGYKIVWQPRD